MSSLFFPCNQDGVAASINTVLPSNRGAFISASAFVQFANHVWWNGLCFLNSAQSGTMTTLQSNWLRLPGAETPLCSKHLLQPHNYQSVISLKEVQRKVNAGKLRRQPCLLRTSPNPAQKDLREQSARYLHFVRGRALHPWSRCCLCRQSHAPAPGSAWMKSCHQLHPLPKPWVFNIWSHQNDKSIAAFVLLSK